MDIYVDIQKIKTELTRNQFLNSLNGEDCETYFNYKDDKFDCTNEIGLEYSSSNNHDCTIGCKECWLKAIENIKFKDELEDIKVEGRELNEENYSVDDLLKQIEEYKKKIVDLNRDNINIADRVHNEALKDLKEITQQYEDRIAKLRAEYEVSKSPACDCMIDPKEERKRFKSIADENIRLKNIIKLMSESL